MSQALATAEPRYWKDWRREVSARRGSQLLFHALALILCAGLMVGPWLVPGASWSVRLFLTLGGGLGVLGVGFFLQDLVRKSEGEAILGRIVERFERQETSTDDSTARSTPCVKIAVEERVRLTSKGPRPIPGQEIVLSCAPAHHDLPEDTSVLVIAYDNQAVRITLMPQSS